MLVNNNKKTFIHLHAIEEKEGKKGFPGMAMKPGPNQIPSHAMSIYKNHPTVKAMLDSGDLSMDNETEEFEGKTAAEESEMEATHLIAMKPNAANGIVKETTNVEILKSWLQAENAQPAPRKGVLAALNKQIETLSAPGEKRDREALKGVTTGRGADHTDLGEAKPQAGDE